MASVPIPREGREYRGREWKSRRGFFAMLIYSYNIWMVLASVAISMMAAFTGLSLTRGLSLVSEGVRHLRIAMAAIALGGGIWSMHFVAMLAMRFDVAVYYAVLPTVASILIAILLAGLALVLMHFGRRTRRKTILAGVILGAGIVTMHYVGLLGIEGCEPLFRPAGFIVAGILATGMGIAAMRVAYGRRTERDILLATLIFGASVVIVHFSAMFWTDFVAALDGALSGPGMDNAQLAIIVLLSAFVISGAFLLSGASFLSVKQQAGPEPVRPPSSVTGSLPADPPAPTVPATGDLRLPFERDGMIHFIPVSGVAALRAEGHYTIAYSAEGRVFCPWSISEAERRLLGTRFFRVHRSYLVNTEHVTAVVRRKDGGICRFDGSKGLEQLPVSRSRIPALLELLGL